jgi:hypothetical protein
MKSVKIGQFWLTEGNYTREMTKIATVINLIRQLTVWGETGGKF